jgi:Oxidoreductase molybdopterin binding domain
MTGLGASLTESNAKSGISRLAEALLALVPNVHPNFGFFRRSAIPIMVEFDEQQRAFDRLYVLGKYLLDPLYDEFIKRSASVCLSPRQMFPADFRDQEFYRDLYRSLAALKRFPSRTQITKHTCEEGWSAIAEWTGVPLRSVLEAAGVQTSARFVNFYAFDDAAEGLDMLDALHPQTILAYGMNGRDLPVPHVAPVRLRVERQVGYKSIKYVQRIVVKDEFDDLGRIGDLQNGWSWYAGI